MAKKATKTKSKTSTNKKSPAKPKTKAGPLRYAFIGAGGIAAMHMRLLAKMNDVQLVALADVNQKGMADRAKEFGIDPDNCYTDWKQMLTKVKPDAVSICTPNSLHAQPAIDAAKAGTHVLVEKPMAMSPKEAQAMIDAADKYKTKLVIGFQYRFSPKTQFLKSAVDAGDFGKVMYARVQALRRRGIPNWGVFGRKDLQGGGPMIDIGVHCIEMAHYTMGSPTPVAAVGQTFTYLGNKQKASKIHTNWPNWDWKTYTVEDLAVGQIRFDNGAILNIESSFAAHIEKDTFNFTLMGEKAGGNWEPPQIYTDQNNYMVNQSPKLLPGDEFAGNFALKMRNFVEHCLHDKPTLAPAAHGLAVQKMLNGIYDSAEKGGREVKLS